MEKFVNILTILFFICIVLLTGCADIGNKMKHIQSSAIGLKRNVTVYSLDGTEIKSWTGRCKIEEQSSKTKFVMNGKSVYINGGVTIIEEVD